MRVEEAEGRRSSWREWSLVEKAAGETERRLGG
jgi:hypothetical protein